MNATLPDTTRIGTVSLTVTDLPRALAFYEGVLGMRVLAHEDDEATLGVDAPVLRLHGDAKARRRPPRTTGLYHMAIVLPTRADLGRALANLVQRRWPVEGASDHLVSEAVYLSDPEGNGIELYRDRPRDEWRRDAGGVHMATARMDVDAVLAEAEGAAWSGMPEGTRMGHVHLQVDDVRAAESFYRDTLGLDLTARYGDEASFFSAGGYHHHVAANSWASRGAAPPPPDSTGLREFTVLVPDAQALDDVAERLRKAERPVEREGGDVLTVDPAGNRVRLGAG